MLKLDIQLFADGKVVIETDLKTKNFEKGLEKMKGLATLGFATMTAAAVGVAAAFANILKESVKSYAALEQNIGGIEKLYGKSANELINKSKDAFKTAGISANQYLETTTSFSASLIKGLGNDTEQAVGLADMAIKDMSDNANTFGTSMDEVMNVYKALSKEQYITLDNLRLGYAGTKKGMQELIADAASYTDIQKELGITVDASSMSFDNIIKAISVMQKKLNITGTTSKEAANTITGSFNSAKAAWDNFLSGASDASGFIEAVSNLVKNVSKMLIEMAPQLVDGLVEIVNSIVEQIPKLFETVVPILVPNTMKLINVILKTLIKFAPELLKMGIELIVELCDGLAEGADEFIPQIIATVIELFMILTDQKNIEKLTDAGIKLLLALIDGIIKSFPELLKNSEATIKILTTVFTGAVGLTLQIGWAILKSLVKGIIEKWPDLKKHIGEIIDKLKEKFAEGVSKIKDVGKQLILGLWNGIQEKWNQLKNKVTEFGNGIVNKFKSVFGIKSPSRVFRDEIGKYLAQGIGVGFEEEIDDIYKDMQKAIDTNTNKINSNIETSGTYQVAMKGLPEFNLTDNSENTTQLVVNGKVLAEVVNRENKLREVASA